MTDQKQSQLDESEHFDRKIEAGVDRDRAKDKLVKDTQSLERTRMIVTFYLSLRAGTMPSFHDRTELAELPTVGSVVEISSHEPDETMLVSILANSVSNPEHRAVLKDDGAWVICQET